MEGDAQFKPIRILIWKILKERYLSFFLIDMYLFKVNDGNNQSMKSVQS